ncbi:transmembrane signal receptor [Lithospermum erythrorhizon]|uniref:Transmembrane signal receptor n=1 Tax=Lithospermum erythrorhizon TaxID=34254 RepID=A0AAV3RMR3_LITER
MTKLISSRKYLSIGSFRSVFALSNFFLIVVPLLPTCFACNQEDYNSLLAFRQQNHPSTASSTPLNWTSLNCCQWEGVSCGRNDRVKSLWLPRRGLSGTISPSITNLTHLSHLNLSHNQLSDSLPNAFFKSLSQLQVLDLSYNALTGNVLEQTQSSDNNLPVTMQNLDLSSNHFNGSIEPSLLQQAFNLIFLNVSTNSFSGTIPVSICRNTSLVKVLDFSMNHFNDQLSHGLASCSNLEIFRAGSNSLSGLVPYDIFSVKSLKEISLPSNQLSGTISHINLLHLSNLTLFELQFNNLSGELPKDIGYLSNLENLVFHTNNFTGPLPPSLQKCRNLIVLLLRNNKLEGDITDFDFSKLHKLASIDLGYNNFTGSFPASLCWCRSLNAIRFAYNNLHGEVPDCVSRIKKLEHISLSNTFLVNATGALKILMSCKNLTVIFMSRTFTNETLPSDESMGDIDGFQNLEILTLGGGKFSGEVPNWISKLKKLKVLNLSFNKVSGPVPIWLGGMPDLVVINFTGNHLSGQIPKELGHITALSAENDTTDFGYLALPFFFTAGEYNRLFNLPRGLKLGGNNLSGNIPVEIGRLKQLQMLDLNNNNLSGGIPNELSNLVNLLELKLSNNSLTGEIPASLTRLTFLSSFSVANNDLEGEIPLGGQLQTFNATPYEGNPKLCGYMLHKSCILSALPTVDNAAEEEESDSPWIEPVWIGYLVGLSIVCLTLVFHSSWRNAYFDFLNRLFGKVIKSGSSKRRPAQTVQQQNAYNMSIY